MTDITLALDGIKNQVAESHKEIEAKMAAVSDQSDTKGAEYKTALEAMDNSIKSLNDQILELAQKHSTPVEVMEKKSFGSLVMESDGVKAFLDGTANRGKAEIKNTIINSGNETSQHEQLPGVVPGAFRQLTVMPTVMQGSTSSNIIHYPSYLRYQCISLLICNLFASLSLDFIDKSV